MTRSDQFADSTWQATMTAELIVLLAEPEEHDAILLERVARWSAVGPLSFVRANKPEWQLEITRYTRGVPTRDAAEAVADSALVLELLREEQEGHPVEARREIVLRAMELLARRLQLAPTECRRWHEDGYTWAIQLGRWDEQAVVALERRFEESREGIDALLAAPADPRIAARWDKVVRPMSSKGRIDAAQALLSSHANRLGVFAETEAILHFFMYRRCGGAHAR
jgi:hypothetical protein